MTHTPTYFPYHLDGKAEQEALIVTMEAERAPFELTHAALFEVRLTTLTDEAASALEKHLSAEAAMGVLHDEALTAEYEALIVDVVPHFAGMTYDGIKEYLPPHTKTLLDLWQQLAVEYITHHIAHLGRLAMETFRAVVQAVISDGVEAGISMQEMGRYLRAEMPDLVRVQAERIVRTETIAASNYGSQAGARATGLPLMKMWLSTLDGRTRDTHRAMNEAKVPLDDPYMVPSRMGFEAAMYPGDPVLSAGNRVGCRCAESYEVVG